jgi:DNA-binding NarL/FixJ family response regulator
MDIPDGVRVGAFVQPTRPILLRRASVSLYLRTIILDECMATSHDKIRVLLVDDLINVRQILRSTLDASANIEVVGEASDGEEALMRVEHLRPSVVIMDIYMSRMDGITATRLIKEKYPQIAVIGLTIEQKDFQLYAMHKAGATEVLAKDRAAELPEAIQRAVERPA